MPLTPGMRLGPYEILAPLGAGGMGEVYRARDARLGRDVAIKVLAPEFSADADRLRRFEQEARAASALNHPNILTIFDVGESERSPYVVSELLEGETLRERLSASPLTPRKAVELALQIARGLGAAHEMGIIHRDLKPENLFLTKDGRIKILDFGLAKLAAPRAGSAVAANEPTVPVQTESGMVFGTVGYMSPEQVRGQQTDHRSDIFSFGSILYEMLTGQRAFRSDSGVETMSAILKDDPPLLVSGSPLLSPGLDRVVRHCLEKNREERFQSASDLAFALESLSGMSMASGVAAADVGTAHRGRPRAGSRPWKWLAAAGALAAGAAAVYFAGARSARVPAPSFKQLSFRRGSVLTARFARDGDTIVYGAAWDGGPFQIYSMRPESPESSLLPLPAADLLSLSPSGELAMSLGRRFVFAWMSGGTLARAPLAGGSPREVLEAVQEADWSPDGMTLAAVHRVAGRHRLEYPIGKSLYETAGWVGHPRVSADGTRIAFIDHPIYGDDRGAVAIVDLAGVRTTLTPEFSSAQGLAWAPGGREIWFTAADKGLNNALHAVSLAGRLRPVMRGPGRLTLLDISTKGRVLLSRDQSRVGIIGLAPGRAEEKDLSWLDASGCAALSSDGSQLLFGESGEGGGARYGTYLRQTDGSPAARLGDGQATALSPDGKSALAIVYGKPDELRVLPTGAGEAKRIAPGIVERFHWAVWMPDGKGVLFTGNEAGKGLRIYRHDLAAGSTRPVTPEGIGYLLPPTPDGRFVPSTDAQGRVLLYPLNAGGAAPLSSGAEAPLPSGAKAPLPLIGLEPGDIPLQWSPDGRSLFVRRRGGLPVRLELVDRTTGVSRPWKTIAPSDRSGVIGISAITLSQDGGAYAYTYHRLLSELYLVDGLR